MGNRAGPERREAVGALELNGLSAAEKADYRLLARKILEKITATPPAPRHRLRDAAGGGLNVPPMGPGSADDIINWYTIP